MLEKDIHRLTPDQKRQLLDRLLRERRAASPSTPTAPGGFIYPEDYENLRKRFDELVGRGMGQIYGVPCEGINGNFARIGDRVLLNFSSYNYLGLSGHPDVSQAAKDAIDRYGTSVSASRLASGERPVHSELERALAGFLGVEESVVFVGGFVTNETVLGPLCGQEDLILYDSLIHSSVRTGCRLSGAAERPFPHNNWEAVDHILTRERAKYRQVLVVIEGVYSMDGDIPDLPRFIEIKRRHRALLMIDEAHSLGVLGERGAGIGEHYGVARQDVDIWMGTLSKALASCGGYVAGSAALMQYLRHTSPGYVYSVGMPPASAAAALAALRLLIKEPKRVARLRERSALFLKLAKSLGLNTGASHDSAVIPVIPGSSLDCLRLYRSLLDEGVLALPILFPVVPENAARVRFFTSCLHTEEQIQKTVAVIGKHLQVVKPRS
jgi:8-amino-7-oxononanoate synthase